MPQSRKNSTTVHEATTQLSGTLQKFSVNSVTFLKEAAQKVVLDPLLAGCSNMPDFQLCVDAMSDKYEIINEMFVSKFYQPFKALGLDVANGQGRELFFYKVPQYLLC
jgi:hypothetical protein